MKKKSISVVLLILVLSSCNLPTPASSNPSAGNDSVKILSPQGGATLPADAVSIQFTAEDGPFIEADLLVDNSPVSFVAQDASSRSINGMLSWDRPTSGKHTLTVQVLTLNKEIYSASVQVMIEGGSGQSSSGDQTPMAQSGPDAGLDAARQRIIQILHDDYGLTITNPPVGRKVREGVTTDPWTSALYYKDTFISISIYPDGREEHHAYPLNYSDPSDPSSLIKPEDKPIPMCRPSGTIKLLVVFVDYQNLDVTQQEAIDSLTQTVGQINGKYVEASQAGGIQNPILKLQATGAFISSQTIMTGHLITPDLVRTATGYDPAQFDILVQIDLDANDTTGMTANLGSYAYATSGCGDLPVDVNMWIAISKKDQLSQTNNDPRLQYTLGHEILHTMGYPIGLTGVHEWVCGDGSLPDLTDQCDQNNLPTLMMGWTDTDGDGVVELLDTTPYGLQAP